MHHFGVFASIKAGRLSICAASAQRYTAWFLFIGINRFLRYEQRVWVKQAIAL